jgi:putative resolvase
MVFHPVLWHATDMKLRDYAKQVGVTHKIAWQWRPAGHVDAHQLPTGTSIVRDVQEPPTAQTAQTAASGVALYARVSSAEQQDAAMRQLQRLGDDAAARSYAAVAKVTEIASGLTDVRSNLPNLRTVFTGPRVGISVVEHRDRLTRVGYGYVATLLAQQSHWVEALAPSAAGEGLADDFVADVTSVAACIHDCAHLWPLFWLPHQHTPGRAMHVCIERVPHSEGEDA